MNTLVDYLDDMTSRLDTVSLTSMDDDVAKFSQGDYGSGYEEFDGDEDEERPCRVCDWVKALSIMFGDKLHTPPNSTSPRYDHLEPDVSFGSKKIKAQINGGGIFQNIWIENDFLCIDRTPSSFSLLGTDFIRLSRVVQVMKSAEKSKMTLYIQEVTGHIVFINLHFEKAGEMEELFACIKQVLEKSGRFFVSGKHK